MKSPLLLAVAALLVFATPACESTGGGVPATSTATAAPSVDIAKLLGGVTDGPSAEAAKGPLEGAIAALKTALAGATAGAKAEAATTGATPEQTESKVKQVTTDVLTKFGLGADSAGMIGGLLGNPAVVGAIGPLLEQLKGMLPAM
jgi:hypothetical protein